MNLDKRSRLYEADLSAIDTLSEGDPARDLIAEILSIVRVSHWSFARFKGNGSDQLLLPENGENRREEFEHLRQEFVLQRERTTKGPRMAAALSTFEGSFVSGITLVFADMRREFGVLSLLRTEELEPFTSVEIQALALALDASTDRLSGLALAEAPYGDTLDTFDQPTMLVLDRDLKVVLTWDGQEGRDAALTELHARLAQRLPPIIEETVRDLIASWTADPTTQASGVAHPVPFLTVRTQPLSGPTGLFVGVLLERPPSDRVFNNAARAFRLSPRELETLALLLQGTTLSEVGKKMNITVSTVQDHIKNMLEKTGSRNRSELIAKLLSRRPSATKPP
ncbi:MAG TPA: helix-turn-helix transcriptional regulator [Candidatus Baltobacteraceae bacterium]